jgi:hypothetical protein
MVNGKGQNGMGKKYLLLCLFLSMTGILYSQSRYYGAELAQNFFLDFNTMYNYEKYSSDKALKIKTNNLLFEIALGYDFGFVVPRIGFDYGFSLARYCSLYQW